MTNYFLITEFGAKEGVLSTEAIQKTFDAASKEGGTVIVPKGTFISGTLNMGSASLYLEKGAVLKASTDPKDYYPNGFVHNEMKDTISFLYSLNADDIMISGKGRIDLSGDAFYDFNDRQTPDPKFVLTEEQFAQCTPTIHFRPSQPIFFLNGTHITVKDVTITDAPCWTVSFHNCEDIRVEGVTIKNNLCLPNNDGIHFCGCRRAIVHGCNITSGDDCIALSGITNWNIPCENIVISDCVMTSTSKTIVIGYMHSIIRNVCISNCVITGSQRGICFMTSADTSLIENVVIENILIDTTIHAGNWWGNGEPICMFALFHDSENYLAPIPDHRFKVNMNNIQMRNISCRGENIIGIIGKDNNLQNVSIDGLYYERIPSKNGYIKGINRVDISPAEEPLPDLGDEPDYWLLIQGCKNISIRNANVQPFNGVELKTELHNCVNVEIIK